MTDRATLSDILRSLSGGALRLDDEGQCIIHDPDGTDFRIEVPAAGDRVYWIAPLGQHRGAQDSAISERLLTAGFLALDTRGAQLSIDPQTREIVLWISLPLAELAPATVEKVTVNFADLAGEWARRLIEWRQAEPSAPSADEFAQASEELISFRI